MKPIKMVDLLVHIDETLGHDRREEIRDVILARDGIMAAVIPDSKPHLLSIEYDPDKLSSQDLLKIVTKEGVHAELVGL